ncbi:MAG: hypothetical protein AAF600_12470 [Bacteroidota bacterium]
MNLQESLDKLKVKIEGRKPSEYVEIMHGSTRDLEASGLGKGILKVGDKAPYFEMPNQVGQIISSESLLTNTVQIASDSRGVGDIEFTTLGPDNAVYVWSDFATPWISAVRDSSVPANFVLRIPDGSNEFDPDYFVTISDNGEDVPLYVYQQFPNGDVLADVRITDVASYTLEGGPRGVNGWRQAIVPWPNFDQVNIVEEIPIGGEGFLNLKSDGKVYSLNFNNDDFSSKYYQWTSSRDFQKVFRTDGSTVILPHVIVRLR